MDKTSSDSASQRRSANRTTVRALGRRCGAGRGVWDAGRAVPYGFLCKKDVIFKRDHEMYKFIKGIDMNKFIFEIQSRPAIWDIRCEEYSDRVQKAREWDEVVKKFTGQDVSISEKKKQGVCLQKKWRNIRDTFVKDIRQTGTVKSGPGVSKKHYKYFKQLSFLTPVISTNTTDNTVESDENNDSVGTAPEENIESVRKKKKSTPSEEIDSELLSVLKATLQQKTEEEDSDRQFLLSLVDDFKRVPMRLKPKVKINMIKCIMEAQDEVQDCHQTFDAVSHNKPHGSYFEFSYDQPSTSNIKREQSPTIKLEMSPQHSE